MKVSRRESTASAAMNIAGSCLEKRIVTMVLMLPAIRGGCCLLSEHEPARGPGVHDQGRSRDHPYPGESALEVEEEVTDEIEQAAEQPARSTSWSQSPTTVCPGHRHDQGQV